MKTYRLTETADRQLQEIWRYTRNRWGAAQADAYLARIDDALDAAVKMPALLRPRLELGAGVVARKTQSHIAYGIVHGALLLLSPYCMPEWIPNGIG